MEEVILCIGTMDSKGPELEFLSGLICDREGYRTIIMDISCRGSHDSPAHITPGELAEMAGASIDHVRNLDEAGPAAAIMSLGARRKTRQMYEAGEFDAVVAIGGGMGSEIASAAMRDLPVGVPKLMLSYQKSSRRVFGTTWGQRTSLSSHPRRISPVSTGSPRTH